MIDEKISEGNRMIAEFMGAKIIPNQGEAKIEHFVIDNDRLAIWDLKYNTSWDWLKPVIEKIGNVEFTSIRGMREYMNVHFSESKIHIYQKIDVVYSAVVEFIKWYNEAITKKEEFKRENGFYCVSKEKSGWTVAEYKDGYWFLIGTDCHYSDYDFTETHKYIISENKIKNG